ncbi:Uncharacterised protein [Shigella sonnei]|nr:Uncharacterised protein [Shigella sonnei]
MTGSVSSTGISKSACCASETISLISSSPFVVGLSVATSTWGAALSVVVSLANASLNNARKSCAASLALPPGNVVVSTSAVIKGAKRIIQVSSWRRAGRTHPSFSDRGGFLQAVPPWIAVPAVSARPANVVSFLASCSGQCQLSASTD